MSIVFVTVGTSSIGNEELWEKHPELARRLPRTKNLRRFLQGLEDGEAPPAGLEELILSAHEAYWDHNDNYRSQHRRLTSAEAASTWSAIRDLKLFQLLPGRDSVVLLASNTPVGQLSARINQAIFKKHLFELAGGEVSIETIKDLSPGGFVTQERQPIYAQIYGFIKKHLKGHAGKVFFNITGSYKGVIPPITHIVTTWYPESMILYMHENMEEAVELTFEDAGRRMKEGRFRVRSV